MEFKLVQQIVKNIQDTIANSAIGSSRALMAHTFKTKTVNFPKTQKINGIVTVSNQKRVEKELKTGNIIQRSVLKWLKGFKLPTSMEVSNFPPLIKQLPYPTKMEVSNFPPPVKPIKNIRVANQPTKEIEALGELLKQVKKAVKGIKLNPTIKVQAPKAEKIIVPPASVSVTQQKIDYKKLAKLIPVAKEIDYNKLATTIAKEIAQSVVTVGGGGGTRKEGLDDLTRSYNIADKDDDGTSKYFGFTGRTGDWYILKEDTTTNEYRYIKGSSGYATNWTGRAALIYDYYHEVF